MARKIGGTPSGIGAEFRAEQAIVTSTAGRQNKPFYEQNLSKPIKVAILSKKKAVSRLLPFSNYSN